MCRNDSLVLLTNSLQGFSATQGNPVDVTAKTFAVYILAKFHSNKAKKNNNCQFQAQSQIIVNSLCIMIKLIICIFNSEYTSNVLKLSLN